MLQLGDLTLQTSSTPAILRERVEGLFRELHLSVFRYVLCKMRNPGNAEDVTQESFLRLFCQLRDGRPVENPKAWLFTVAHNLAVDAMRGESRFEPLDETAWEQLKASRTLIQLFA